jgi:ubiquinone/menaquinone biosynthesis C-methylase UbiE
VSLREAWDGQADDWIRFARQRDVYAWRFNLPAFLELVPDPGGLTLDIGCGEGRVARELIARGHTVIGIDGSAALVEAAKAGDPPIDARVADAAALPVEDGTADLVISFMALQSVDDLPGAMKEASRVLEPGGRLCVAVVHPMNSLEDSPHDYFAEHAYAFQGDGVVFHDVHRPLSAYFEAMTAADLVVERLAEPVPGPALLDVHPQAERWTRTPCFLHFRAARREMSPAGAG